MLVLTRKLQEKIQIGNEITITILRVKGNTVRVGIEAPRDVRVVRAELPRFEGAPTDATLAATEASSTAEVHGELEFELAADSNEATTGAPESTAKGPSVGRRFIIKQKVGRFGRPQITAVAAT